METLTVVDEISFNSLGQDASIFLMDATLNAASRYATPTNRRLQKRCMDGHVYS